MKKIIFLLLIIYSISDVYAEDIIYSNTTDGVYLYRKSDSDTNSGTKIVSINSTAPTLSADKQYIAYLNGTISGPIYLKELTSTGNGTQICADVANYVGFANDGETLFYKKDTTSYLWKMTVGSGNCGSVVLSFSVGASFDFSPDGTEMIYLNNTDGSKIYKKSVFDTSTGSAINSVNSRSPKYSKDGQTIVYINRSDGNKLYKKWSDDTDDGIAIGTVNAGEDGFAISTDGNSIVYARATDGYKLYKKSFFDTSTGSAINSVLSKYPIYVSIAGQTNQEKPNSYYANINTDTLQEDSGNGNCLYTNPNSNIFDRLVQYCKADDYSSLAMLYNIFCEGNSDLLGDKSEPYRAYVHGVKKGSKFFIQSLICAYGNNESKITNTKRNSLTTIEPYKTFPSILTRQEPFSSGYVNVFVYGILQNYPISFTDFSPLTDSVRSVFGVVNEYKSPIAVGHSTSTINTNSLDYYYYIDNNYYSCAIDHSLTCPLTPPIFNINSINYMSADQYSTFSLYANQTYASTGTLDLTGTIIDTPPGTIFTNPNKIPNTVDTSIFSCNFEGLTWYEYLGSPIICGFTILTNMYNKTSSFVSSVSEFIQNLFSIGNDNTPTKSIMNIFIIQKTYATEGNFLTPLGEGLQATAEGEGQYLGKYYTYLWYGIYSLLFMTVITLFLVYKK